MTIFLKATSKFLTACLLFLLPLALSGQESRAIYDEEFSWLTKKSADNMLSRIKKAGFNVLVPVVWHGRGVTWSSKLAPKEPKWTQLNPSPTYDPLKYLIKKAHLMNIEVHPWFTVVLRQRDFFTDFYDGGTPEKAFDIHNAGFRRFITDLIVEVVKKYDVDGINLDYVRSRGICRCDRCQADYLKRYNRDLKRDIATMRISADSRTAITDWNCRSMTGIVEGISREVRMTKPNIIISVDSLAGDETWQEQGADSIKWANNGWVDVIYHMDYRKEINVKAIQKATRLLSDPDKLVVLVGNFDGLLPREEGLVARLVSFAQGLRPGGNGVALYEYRFLTDLLIEELRSGPFEKPALPNWKKGRNRKSERK